MMMTLPGPAAASITTAPALSVVVPAYNEEAGIAACVEQLRAALQALAASWEIVVADDGSRDRTADIVRDLVAADPRVRLLALPHRGKGATVRDGLLAAAGDWRYMADADLSTPADNIARFLQVTCDHPGVSIVIGSREAPGAERLGEPWTRHVIGRVFNWFVRAVAVRGIHDTQCGFKLFRAAAATALLPRLQTDGFAFDVELLFLARRAGLEVREVGVLWRCRTDSRVAVSRGAAAFWEVLRIRGRALAGRYDRPPATA